MSTPSALERECCCASSGWRLCSVHWLKKLRELSACPGKVFSFTLADLRKNIERLALATIANPGGKVGTHAFRRGMAQDIIDAGGSLAVLMRAGEWKSRAFLNYLREAQPQETAVARAVINLSDSEDER